MYKYAAIKINGVKIDLHRHIYQCHIGRKLERNEIVHHIDGDFRNNEISNLELMSRSDHSRMHSIGRIMDASTKEKLKDFNRMRMLSIDANAFKNQNKVSIIREMLLTKRQCDIAKELNVSRYVVCRIANNKSFEFVPK